MYLDFYGLAEPPFAITPDPRFVFLSERHRDALAHLLYGVGQGGSGGFVQLTGEVGTGKTTLSRLVLEQLPENTRVALVLNPRVSPCELLETICEELKLPVAEVRGSLKGLVDTLSHHLLDAYAQGLRIVLMIDEAQNLSTEALEQVRLLTNLETPTQKLLQIILLGQPELRAKLDAPELRQLAQRVTARYHLTPLDEDETDAYLRHRIAVAGGKRFPFTRLAVRALHRRAKGVPRLLNVIAERALLAGYVADETQIGERLVEHAAAEVLGIGERRRRHAGALVLTVALLALAGWWLWPRGGEPALPPATTATPTATEFPGPPSPTPADDLSAAIASLPAGADLAAWTQLLALWQVDTTRLTPGDAARCPPAIYPGLACLRATGNLARLARLGRPVLLVLHDGDRTALALLRALDRERARLHLGTREVVVERAALEALWFGEFLAIWKAPAFVPDHLRRGEVGPAASWLRRALAAFDRLPGSEVGPHQFDGQIEARVRRVQSSFGLLPDGIVGPETQFALTSRDGQGPRLSDQPDAPH